MIGRFYLIKENSKTNFFEKLETMDFKNVYEDTNYLFKNDHLIMFE